MRILSLLMNAALAGIVLAVMIRVLRRDGHWNSQKALHMFRYFTTLSNVFCGVCAALFLVFEALGRVPGFIWLLKYLGTVSVTVTLLTVLLFLAPAKGSLKALLRGSNLYFHLICPLLAILSFTLCELRRAPVYVYALGALPVLVYGLVYLQKVCLTPLENRWNDFYGFNRDGRWRVSFRLMQLGGLGVCALYWFLSLVLA